MPVAVPAYQQSADLFVLTQAYVRTLVLLLSSLAPPGNCQSRGHVRNT